MAINHNYVCASGYLGADPEVRKLNNGSEVVNFTFGCTERWGGSGRDAQEHTEWFRCVLYGGSDAQNKQLDVVDKYLRKGDPVQIEGRLRTRKWEDKDGVDRYTTEVILGRVELIGQAPGGGGGGGDNARSSGRDDRGGGRGDDRGRDDRGRDDRGGGRGRDDARGDARGDDRGGGRGGRDAARGRDDRGGARDDRDRPDATRGARDERGRDDRGGGRDDRGGARAETRGGSTGGAGGGRGGSQYAGDLDDEIPF